MKKMKNEKKTQTKPGAENQKEKTNCKLLEAFQNRDELPMKVPGPAH